MKSTLKINVYSGLQLISTRPASRGTHGWCDAAKQKAVSLLKHYSASSVEVVERKTRKVIFVKAA
jgi:hypothetical protein